MSDTPNLYRDLAPFRDPATDAKVDVGKSGTRVQFVRNGTEVDYFFNHSDGVIQARHKKNQKFSSIRSMLASTDFADMKTFISTQARLYRDFDLERLLPPEGTFSDGRRAALQTIQRVLISQSARSNSALSILLLDGPAGIGKTSLIQRLLVQRARSHYEVNSAPPILHVSSRGRRLTALDDALAQSLQILRAQFTFDQIPTLIRYNLVQLAIDGFDELVDPEGYQDAWFALRDFLDQTEYGGPIILAGRDTFFDQQSFASKMQEARSTVSIERLRLGPVSPVEAKKWLMSRGWREKDIKDPYTDLILRPGSYALRPYFLQELEQAKGWEALGARDLTPREYLVDRFIAREADLVSDKLSLGVDEVKNNLASIFEEIAVEMADTETDAVDLSFLQMVTELSFGNQLSQTDIAKLRHKAGSFALLESDPREGFRRFPHTEISHHFLAKALVRLIGSDTPLRFMRRGIVSSDLLTILAEIVLSRPLSEVDKFIGNLEQMLSNETTFDRQSENAAALLITCLSRDVGEGRKRNYQDLQLSSAVLLGNVAPSRLERIRIHRLDVNEASLVQVEFIDCEVADLHADETTRFGSSIPKVHQIHLTVAKGSVQEIFDPEDIARWFSSHSVGPALSERVNQTAVRLLDRVCRVMLRQHMIKDHESDESGKLLRNSYWPAVERILTDAGLLDRVKGKAMAGAYAPFIRMRDPYSILAHRKMPKIAAIWDKVSAIPD